MTLTHLETSTVPELKHGNELKYGNEALDLFWQDGKELVKDHFEEVGLNDFNFSVAVDRYLELEAQGAIKAFTIRDGDLLVGYAIFFLGRHGHVSEICARCDSLYVDRKYRGRCALGFLKWCDEQLKKLGVKFVLHSVTKKKDYSSLLNRMGYNHIEDIYLRVI